MDVHDVIQLLSALAVLLGAITAFLVVYYNHKEDDE